MPKRTADQDKHHRQGFNIGIVVAASILMSTHGAEVEAEELLHNVGLSTRAKAKAAGVDDYDLKILRPVFRHINNKRRPR